MSRPISASQHRLITGSVMLASIMQALDNTIANVALPHIQGSLSATEDQMTWVLTSYIIAAAIMTPLSGWLAGRFGRKRIFLFSIMGFTISSAFCGLAQSLSQMVVGRLLQGLCGAALIPMSQAVLLDINPPQRHAQAMALWVMGVTIGPILGPALGGWLTEQYNWRWVFYINVPFGILSYLGIRGFLRETDKVIGGFDWMGFLTLSLAVGSLQLLLDRGPLRDWFGSVEIRFYACVALLSFYLFVVHVVTTARVPFVRPALFADSNFLTGNIFIFIVGVVLFATLALLPPLLQNELGYPVVLTGVVTAPRGVGTLVAMFVVGRVITRVDARLIIASGFVLTSLSLYDMSYFFLQMTQTQIIWSGLIQGLGTGLVYVPLAAISFATLPGVFRNEGTAIFSLIRNIGSSLGISTVEALLTHHQQVLHERLAAEVTPYHQGWHALSYVQLHSVSGLAALNHEVTHQAAMLAYNNDFWLMMWLSLLAVPLTMLLKRPPTKPVEGQAHVVME